MIDKADNGTSDSCSTKEEASARTSPTLGYSSARGTQRVCPLNTAVIRPLTMAVVC